MLDGLGVLLLGQWIDGTDLLATAGEPCDAVGQRLALRFVERLGGGIGLQLQAPRKAAKFPLGIRGLVPGALETHLGLGKRLVLSMQLSVEVRLLLRACPQRCGDVLPGLAVGAKRGLECLASLRDRAGGGLQRLDDRVDRGREPLVMPDRLPQARDPRTALGTLALGPFELAALACYLGR